MKGTWENEGEQGRQDICPFHRYPHDVLNVYSSFCERTCQFERRCGHDQSSDGTLTNYPTLDQAARAAKDGDTILLNEDIEMSFYTLDGRRQNPMMTIEGKTVTLDGQGHTVTAKDEAFR